MSALVTHHASKRGKQRLGLAKAAMLRTLEIALRDGITTSETSGSLKRYLDKVYFTNQSANNIRIHGEKVFVIAGETLITILNLPNEYKAQAAKIRARREEIA